MLISRPVSVGKEVKLAEEIMKPVMPSWMRVVYSKKNQIKNVGNSTQTYRSLDQFLLDGKTTVEQFSLSRALTNVCAYQICLLVTSTAHPHEWTSNQLNCTQKWLESVYRTLALCRPNQIAWPSKHSWENRCPKRRGLLLYHRCDSCWLKWCTWFIDE